MVSAHIFTDKLVHKPENNNLWYHFHYYTYYDHYYICTYKTHYKVKSVNIFFLLFFFYISQLNSVDVELLLITSIKAAQTGTNLISVGTTLFRNFFIIKHPFLSSRLPIFLQPHYNIKCQQCQYKF